MKKEQLFPGGSTELDSTRRERWTPAGHRVMAHLRNRSRVLISLTVTRGEAVGIAKRMRNLVENRRSEVSQNGKHSPDEVTLICVEEWVGTATDGYWRWLSPNQGGFIHRFDNPDESSRAKRSQTGEIVECVLLPQKTRKHGWKAQIRGGNVAGPITNSDEVPEVVAAGETVSLRIGARSRQGNHIQFQWLPDSRREEETCES